MKVAKCLTTICLAGFVLLMTGVQSLVCNQCGAYTETSITKCPNETEIKLEECPEESTHCFTYKSHSPFYYVYGCKKDCPIVTSDNFKCCKTDGCNGRLQPPPPPFQVPRNDRTRLTEKLLMYYKKIIPNNVTVTFGISLIDFQIADKKQALSIDAWIYEEWIDDRLLWDPANYENITRISWESDWVWKPDITLLNSKDATNMMKCWNSNVIIKSNGSVTWMPTCSMMPSCKLTTDSNGYINCTLKFGAWTYNGNEMDINLRTDHVDLSHLENPSWAKVVGTEAKKNVKDNPGFPEIYVDLEYKLTFGDIQS